MARKRADIIDIRAASGDEIVSKIRAKPRLNPKRKNKGALYAPVGSARGKVERPRNGTQPARVYARARRRGREGEGEDDRAGTERRGSENTGMRRKGTKRKRADRRAKERAGRESSAGRRVRSHDRHLC